jgi:hypothetical protein
MDITTAAAIALVAGILLGLIVRRKVAFVVPFALYVIPVALIVSDRAAFSQDDSTATLLVMYALFLLAPMLLGTALGIAQGRRFMPPPPTAPTVSGVQSAQADASRGP